METMLLIVERVCGSSWECMVLVVFAKVVVEGIGAKTLVLDGGYHIVRLIGD